MSGKITRREIALRLQDEVGSHSEARRFTDAFFEELSNAIASGDVRIHRFGVFRCLNKNARPGRNPRTGESVEITARRVVNFSASDVFKSRVSSYDDD